MPSVLVVDDEQEICFLLREFLEMQSCRVITATTKTMALSRIADREFDLVLVDKNLPDGSGLEVAHAVRARAQSSEIILITGYSDLDSALASFRLDVFRYIKKPFDLDLLLVDVTGALETRRVKRDLAERTAELVQANRELRQSEERFRELADLLPGIVLETDDQGALSFVNRTGLSISGYDLSTFTRKFNDHTLIAKEDRHRWKETIRGAMAGEPFTANEFLLCGEPDGEMSVLMQAVPRKGGGLRAVLLDITAHKQTEKHLREKETQLQLSQKMEAIGSLAGGVAHDFNNMLSVIRGYSDVLLLDVADTNPIREDVLGIIEASERSSELTRRLLAFSRRQVIVPKNLDLNAVVCDMEKMLRRLLNENITLKTRLPDYPLYINADKGQLEQVLLNLVVNARDAMPEGGDIEIETRHEVGEESAGSRIRLSVSDTGHGMDETTRRRIFEPFFTTKETGKGTGLGLSTVYDIVTQSGGMIHVRSEPGKGSRFDIAFVPSEALPVKVSSIPPNKASLSGTETILVVEDEEMVLDIVARLLGKYGYTILTARQAGDALLLCENHDKPIHLLLVDVVLPRVNGIETAKRLQKIHPEMSVLYMSGYSDAAIVRELMVAQPERFIRKPFSAQEMATKVREVLTKG